VDHQKAVEDLVLAITQEDKILLEHKSAINVVKYYIKEKMESGLSFEEAIEIIKIEFLFGI
jgi:hypothetical protein